MDKSKMTNVSIDKVVVNPIDGKPFPFRPELDENGNSVVREMTVRRALVYALTTPTAQEQNYSGEEKFRRFALAVKIQNAPMATEDVPLGDSVNFTGTEINLLCRAAGETFVTMMCGALITILDPNFYNVN